MTKYVLPSVEGTDHSRLLYYYTLLEAAGCEPYVTAAITPESHVKLLKKLRAVAGGKRGFLDFLAAPSPTTPCLGYSVFSSPSRSLKVSVPGCFHSSPPPSAPDHAALSRPCNHLHENKTHRHKVTFDSYKRRRFIPFSHQ